MRGKLVAAGLALILVSEAGFGHDLKGLIREQNTGSSTSLAEAIAQTPTADFATKSVLNNLRLWPVPRKLTICFHSGAAALRKRVADSMRRVWPLATLTEGRLDFDTATFDSMPDCEPSPKADVRVDFKDKDGYWSYVGVESRLHKQSMNLEGFTETLPEDREFDRIVGHEAGHALGLEHEHQSPAAPKCGWDFDFLWENYTWASKQDMYDNFTKLQDYISKRKHAYVFSTYDPRSEMHYAFDAKAFKDGENDPCFITQNYTPSDQDKNAIRVAYGPNLVALQTQMKGLLPELPKTIADARLQAILKIKADLLNE